MKVYRTERAVSMNNTPANTVLSKKELEDMLQALKDAGRNEPYNAIVLDGVVIEILGKYQFTYIKHRLP